jgi:hypothetical protein
MATKERFNDGNDLKNEDSKKMLIDTVVGAKAASNKKRSVRVRMYAERCIFYKNPESTQIPSGC